MRLTRLAPVLALALTLAACSGGGEESTSGSEAPEAELETVRMAGIPVVDVVPIVVGIEHGFFEEVGIDLSVEQVDGGPAAVTGVVSGEFEFGFSNVVSMMLARSQDIPLVAFAGGIASTGVELQDSVGLLVGPDSEITSADELEGRSVGVPALRNIGEVTVRESVEAAGGDPDLLEWVEIPGPTLPQAVVEGQVDAIWAGEPQRTQAIQAGAVEIASPNVDTMDGLMMSVFFTSEAFLEEQPDLAQRLRSAIVRSQQYAQDNPDEIRAAAAEFTAIEPEVLEDLVLPVFPTELDVANIELLVERLQTYGFVEEDFSVDGAYYEG